MNAGRAKWTMDEIRRELADVGRVGQIFVDGDLCRRALKPHAETYMKGDDMDFDPEACVPLKKTMLRVERVCRFPCSTALWRRRPDVPESGEALIFGSHGSPFGADKPANRGYQPPKMTPEMEKVFLRGRSAWRLVRGSPLASTYQQRGLAVPAKGVKAPVLIQHLVPVRDSMGEIAAALEVFTMAMGSPGKKDA